MDPSEFKRRADLLRTLADQIEHGEQPTVTNRDLVGLTPSRLREVADTLEKTPGARQRELRARHLLLHPNELRVASTEDIATVREYVKDRTWETMRETDTAMFSLLDAAIATLDKAILDV